MEREQSKPEDRRGTGPKHLRVGVNAAMCHHAALVTLLMRHGITEEEYFREQADEMEREVARYKQELGLPANVDLG